MIRLAQGTPVLSTEGEFSIRIPWEDLREADPEVLIIACCGHKVERTWTDLPILEALPGWQELRAVRSGQTYLADGSAYFSRPGPRIVDTLEMIAAMIHPEANCGSHPDQRIAQVYGEMNGPVVQRPLATYRS